MNAVLAAVAIMLVMSMCRIHVVQAAPYAPCLQLTPQPAAAIGRTACVMHAGNGGAQQYVLGGPSAWQTCAPCVVATAGNLQTAAEQGKPVIQPLSSDPGVPRLDWLEKYASAFLGSRSHRGCLPAYA